MLIEFKNIHVWYNQTDIPADTPPELLRTHILRDVSFSIEPGTSVGLVGHSGCGKSTLAKLLFRAMDPGGGNVLIDGIPFSQYQKNTVLRNIGAVLQRPEMVSGDIRENILFATHPEDASQVSDEEIWEMLDTLTPVLRQRLNGKGLDTLVGKQGLQLSGGQQQLICIARALIKKPEVLIIDEGTASLDAETEAIVQGGLDRAMAEGRSGLVIAHRLSTQRNCDRIVVMKKASDCQWGEPQIEIVCDSIQEAYELSPTYRRLAQIQGFHP